MSYSLSNLGASTGAWRGCPPGSTIEWIAILALADDPGPPGYVKLKGREDWRIRVGDYRIVYGIDDEQRIVEVLNVAHRRDVYR